MMLLEMGQLELEGTAGGGSVSFIIFPQGRDVAEIRERLLLNRHQQCVYS